MDSYSIRCKQVVGGRSERVLMWCPGTIAPSCWVTFEEESFAAEDPQELREALLEHFGLAEWEDELPTEELVYMPPEELMALRQEKEEQYDLKAHSLPSDQFALIH